MVLGDLSDVFGLKHTLEFYFHSDEVSNISGQNDLYLQSLPRDESVLFDPFEHKEVIGNTEAFEEYIISLLIANGQSSVDIEALSREKGYKYVHLMREIRGN